MQKELADERRALKEFASGDPLLSRFFEVFLFEDLPASDRRADEVYLNEVDRCGIYVGLFGSDYGREDADPLFLARYIEKAGTGTLDMIALCAEAGLPTPEFRQDGGQFVQTLRRFAEQVTQPESQPESLDACVVGMLKQQSLSKIEKSQRIGQKEISGRLNQIIRQLLAEHLVEYTIPDKPASRLQKYRLTPKGQSWLDGLHRRDKGQA